MNIQSSFASVLSRFNPSLIRLAAVAVLAVTCATSALALDRTWNGFGADNNWSTALNWSGGAVPSASENVIFDGTSTKNCTISGTQAVFNFTMAAGYTGTITQPGPLTVNGVMTVAAGTFTQQYPGQLTFNGDVLVQGGTVEGNCQILWMAE